MSIKNFTQLEIQVSSSLDSDCVNVEVNDLNSQEILEVWIDKDNEKKVTIWPRKSEITFSYSELIRILLNTEKFVRNVPLPSDEEYETIVNEIKKN